MTAETESLEALHLWLAERLPELRKPYVVLGTPEHPGRETWVPNVTTDGLLEALRKAGWINVDFTFGLTAATIPRVACFIDKTPAAAYKTAAGSTAHEALCRAARKALEATS